jgi:hypothetical protein
VHDDYSPAAKPDTDQGDGKTPTSAGAGPDYADRHVPFLYYANVVGNTARCATHLRPFTELAADLAGPGLPSYAFITPDTCNDGHDTPCADGRPGGLTSADAFLSANVPRLLDWLRSHNGVLFVTFDEGGANDTSGCCNGGPGGTAGFGGQTGMVVLGAPVATGSTSAKYDHASLLRTTEDLLGISTHLNNAASAAPITAIWRPQPQVASDSAAGPGGGTAPTPPAAPDSASAAAIGLPNTAAPASTMPGTLLAAIPLVTTAALVRRRRQRGDSA